MNNVLIIGFFWPYCFGSKRVIGLAKYLPMFGWNPIILTGPLATKPESNFKIIQVPYDSFLGQIGNKLLKLESNKDTGTQLQERFKNTATFSKNLLRIGYNLMQETLAYPDEFKNWKPYALKAADKAIAQNNINGILSIWPATSHSIAKELKHRHRLPWIADFPDLWALNSAYPFSSLRQLFDKKKEKSTLNTTDFITTSSYPYQKRLEALHKKNNIHTIIFGFDPEILNLPSKKLVKKFTITYTGMFYQKKRMPTKFLQALHEFITEEKILPADIDIRFYGPKNDLVQKDIQARNLSNIVTQYDSITFSECISKQRESHLLLQLNWEDKKEQGVFSGKMLDYLAALRPILSVGGGESDIVQQWLNDTGAGIYCATPTDVKNALSAFYKEYKQQGTVTYCGNIEKIKKYSHVEMAKHFADLLNKTIQ